MILNQMLLELQQHMFQSQLHYKLPVDQVLSQTNISMKVIHTDINIKNQQDHTQKWESEDMIHIKLKFTPLIMGHMKVGHLLTDPQSKFHQAGHLQNSYGTSQILQLFHHHKSLQLTMENILFLELLFQVLLIIIIIQSGVEWNSILILDIPFTHTPILLDIQLVGLHIKPLITLFILILNQEELKSQQHIPILGGITQMKSIIWNHQQYHFQIEKMKLIHIIMIACN